MPSQHVGIALEDEEEQLNERLKWKINARPREHEGFKLTQSNPYEITSLIWELKEWGFGTILLLVLIIIAALN